MKQPTFRDDLERAQVGVYREVLAQPDADRKRWTFEINQLLHLVIEEETCPTETNPNE
jgi:hypothetical protein